MGAFATWLAGFVRVALTWLYNHIIDLIQGAMDGLITFIITLASLFPAGADVPTGTMPEPSPVLTLFLQTLNWLFPISFFLTLTAWLIAGMIAYFGIAVILRWAKILT